MRFSICIPTYKRGIEHLQRAIDSVKSQTFKDYELVIEEDTEGKGMAWNTNRVIKQAKGELIKILYQDDYLAYDDALKDIDLNFDDANWLVTASSTCLNPRYTIEVLRGINRIGSPSAITIKNKEPLLFREDLKWVLDCEYYKRMCDKYGHPKILNKIGVVIGIGEWQETNHLSQELKQQECQFLSSVRP